MNTKTLEKGTEQREKAIALLRHLGREALDYDTEAYDENVYSSGGCEYLVLTDEEADERARDYILDSVWAFNPSFIIEHSSALDFDDASEKVVRAIGEQCESGNEAMKKLIDDLDEFIEDAIGADGRGHFINSYDGNEDEIKVNSTYYYIYRMN